MVDGPATRRRAGVIGRRSCARAVAARRRPAAGGIHAGDDTAPRSAARVDIGSSHPAPSARCITSFAAPRDPVAAAAREGPLDLMPRAREGASHGSERTPSARRRGCFPCVEGSIDGYRHCFVRGLVLGFTIAAAVGPISLLVHPAHAGRGPGRRARLRAWASRRPTRTYGAIAAFGLTAITDLLVDWRRALGIVGGTFLLWLAWQDVHVGPRRSGCRDRAPRAGCPAPT